MSIQGETPLFLALHGPGHIKIYARRGTLEAGARLYHCVFRVSAPDQTWIALHPELDLPTEAAKDALDALSLCDDAPDTPPQPLPWAVQEAAPKLPFAQDRARCLTLCLRAEFLRFRLEAEGRLSPLHQHGASLAARLPRLIPALEAALDLDVLDGAAPHLDELVSSLNTPPTGPGNRAYALRLVADCAERVGALPTALAALTASCQIAENGQKLARLVDLLDRLGEVEAARGALQRYASTYRMGSHMKQLQARLDPKDGNTAHGA